MVSGETIDITADVGAGSLYIGLHELTPAEQDTAGVTHTMEKHGILLHWNGHGLLTGIEIKVEGRPVRICEINSITGDINRREY